MNRLLAGDQHPIIRQTARGEFILQLILLGGAVVAFRVLELSFELSLLLLLVLGFSLTTLNVIASATSTNVHLAEIRDLLRKEEV